MYDALAFAPEKEHVGVKSMSEAFTAAEKFEVDSKETAFSDIQVSLNGGANLTINGEVRKMTQWSLQSLCRYLGIPDPFARKIPIDLLQKNITRLLREVKDIPISLLVGKENEIVNIVRTSYNPFPNKRFLTELDKLFSTEMVASAEWESMRLGPRGFDLNIVDPSVKPLEPKVGEVTKIGLRIVNSDTGFKDALASVYLYTLTCKNGATMTSDWGVVRRRANRNISFEKDSKFFMDGVRNLRVNFDRLNKVYNKLPETDLTDFQAESVWKAVNRVTGPEQADAVIAKTEDNRKTIMHMVAAKRSHNRQLFVEDPKEPEAVSVNAYDTHNRITDASKQYNWSCALKLQAIGGRMITMLTEQFLSDN